MHPYIPVFPAIFPLNQEKWSMEFQLFLKSAPTSQQHIAIRSLGKCKFVDGIHNFAYGQKVNV